MTSKATDRDKQVLRNVMDKIVDSKKPMGRELAEDVRRWLREAAAPAPTDNSTKG
jgi:hypothetical protein